MNIESKVLTLSVAYKSSKGGIAQVIKVYSTFYCPFNHISSIKNTSTVGKFFDIVNATLKIVLIFICKDIKIVHIHGASYNSFWRKSLFIYLSKFFKKKVVFHIHGGKFHLFCKKYPKAVQKVLSKCDVVIAVSNFWKEFLSQKFKHSKVELIENVIEKPILLKKSENKTCNFLFLGYLDENKGIYDLLEVIVNNKADYKNKLILHIGGNGETEEVKEIIKSNDLSNIVKFEGWISGEKKYKALSKADVFILPSYNEGLPISILEAMSYNLPILSTPVGGIPEVVENNVNGLLIEPGNHGQLKEAIDILISQSDFRKRAGEESYKRSLFHFPENVKKKLEVIYKELLEA